MRKALRRLVRERAGNCCEYCHTPQSATNLPHAIDHVIPQQHLGPTLEANLCFACLWCNCYKGPNLSGIDSKTGEMARLFNPRTDSWLEHFHWEGAILVGDTATGRATISVLAINQADRIAHREMQLELDPETFS